MSVISHSYFDDYYDQGSRVEVNGSFATAIDLNPRYFTIGNTPGTDPSVATTSLQGSIDIPFDIDMASDVDVFRVYVPARPLVHPTLTIDVDFTTTLDAQVQVFDANGTFIADNDDSSPVDPGSSTIHDSYLSLSNLAAGYYYVSITAFNNDWRGGVSSGGNSTGAYQLNVGISNDRSIVDYGSGSYADDLLQGDQNFVSNDHIDGFAGNDYIDARGGDDELAGGDGADTILGGDGNDQIFGDEDPFSTPTNPEGVVILPDEGPGDEDTIHGDAGDDFINGGRGNDVIEGGAGADTYEGSLGDDRYVFHNGDSTFSGMDSFYVSSSVVDYDSSFNGAGAAGGDIIDFAEMGPVFWHGHDNFPITLGTNLAGGGNGVNDGFFVGNDYETLLVLDNNDDGLLSGTDTIIEFDDPLTFISSDFVAGQVIDPVLGLASDESFTCGNGSDYILAGGGTDTINGGGGIDRLLGESGNDKINGQADNDCLDGGSENDVINGAAGNDYLFGGNGKDVLTGGAGHDRLSGGPGIDRFDYNAIAETGATAAKRDTIADFVHGTDKIDLSTIDANPGGGTSNDTFVFLTHGGFSAAGQIRVISTNGGIDALVRINIDADTSPEATILLQNVTAATITAADFIL